MSKFRDKKLHSSAVAAAKRKFKVWPSAGSAVKIPTPAVKERQS